jgi:TPR repeat protein
VVAAAVILAAAPENPRWHRKAAAQQRPPATLQIAAVTNAVAASRVRLPIEVQLHDGQAKNSFIRIRGLPPTASLSEGYAIAPGAWAVPLNALPNLMLILPVGLEGRSTISITLVNVEGSVLAEAATTLAVTKAAQAPAASSASASATPQREAPPANSTTRALSAPQLAPAERAKAQGLFDMGREQLTRGNIYAARKFFERAAEAGLPESAMALAATYDPDELSRLRVVGLKAEPGEARKWYERARDLGATEAEERLRRLGSR